MSVYQVRFIKSALVSADSRDEAYEKAKAELPNDICFSDVYNQVHIVDSEHMEKTAFKNETDILGTETEEFDGVLREVRWVKGQGKIFGDLNNGTSVELIFNPQYQTYKDANNGYVYDSSEARIIEI